MNKLKHVVAMLLVFSLFAGSITSHCPITAKAETNTQETNAENGGVEIDTTGEDIAASINITSKWDHHYNDDVTITNLSEEKIDDWEICFPFNNTIEHIWNATIISAEDGEYLIHNADWNQDIQAGESVSFGMTVAYDNKISFPEYSYLTRDSQRVRDSYEVNFTENGRWAGHVNGMITITNTGSHRIEDWSLIMESNFEIENIWNANTIDYYEEYECYDIENAGYNQNIEPGQCVQFGFIAKCCGEAAIGEYTLYEMAELDYDDDEFSDEEEDDDDEELIKDADYFDTYDEYVAYFYERNGWKKRAVKSMLRASGVKTVEATYVSTLDFGWDITAAQNYLPLSDGSVYTFHIAYDEVDGKKVMRDDDVWINKGWESGSKSDTYEMFLENPNLMMGFGHGQTFEQFHYKGKEQYLLSGNPDDSEKHFSRDIVMMSPEKFKSIAEMRNESGEPINTSYKKLWEKTPKPYKKLIKANYANRSAKKAGRLTRVDAAITSDNSTLVVWSKMKSAKVQLSLYDMKKICKKLYTKNKKGNYKNSISFADLKKACYASRTVEMKDKLSDAIQPGGSFQSVDVEKDKNGTWNVYITSGNEAKNKTLYISCITLKKGDNNKVKYNIVKVNPIIDGYTGKRELEGCHVVGSKLNFLVTPSGTGVSKKLQYICSVPLNKIKN